MLYPIQYKFRWPDVASFRQVERLGNDSGITRIISGYADGSQIVGPWQERNSKDAIEEHERNSFYSIWKISLHDEPIEMPTSDEMEVMRLGGDFYNVEEVIEDKLHQGHAKHLMLSDRDGIMVQTGIGGTHDFMRDVWLQKSYLEGKGYATVYKLGPFLITKVLWYDI